MAAPCNLAKADIADKLHSIAGSLNAEITPPVFQTDGVKYISAAIFP